MAIMEFFSQEIIGALMIGVMLFAIFIGFPISFTLIFLGLVFGYWGFGKLVFYLMTLQFNMIMTENTLVAVPLFIFMGILMESAGLMERLFSAIQLMLSRTRGALFYAVMFVSTIFAAATGIVGASVTILGIMAGKTMIRSGYDTRLSAGLICAGGTLGILIPPSIMLVVMGPVLEIPVTDLFAAAIIPGIMLAFLYALYTTVRCYFDPKLGPILPKNMQPKSMGKVWIEFFLGLVPPAGLVFFALGSILFGLATPTEGAGIGAIGSIILALAYRKLTLKTLKNSLIKTLEITALIMFLVAASNFFGAVFSKLGTPSLLTEFLLNLDVNRYVVLAILMAVIFLLGWPLEWVPIVLIVLPIFVPLIKELDFNLTWFAILVAVNLQTAWLSPPVALSAYFLKGVVPEWELKDIYLGMMQFMGIQVLGLILIIVFPQIALWLPSVMYP
jgi:tripartite ATP-independent transporter DctM subunit